MRFNVTKSLKSLVKWGSKHSPELLHVAGFAMGATALVLTATGTVKAVRELDEKEPEKTSDKAVIVAKHLAPAGMAAAVSFAFHVMGVKKFKKMNAVLLTWGTWTADRLKKLEDKEIEILGENKAKKIQEAVDYDKGTELMQNQGAFHNIINTGYGDFLFLDHLTGQVFRSEHNAIQRQVNELNARINGSEFIEENEYLEALGERRVDHGDYLGWFDDLIRIRIDYRKAPNGEPIGHIIHSTRLQSLQSSVHRY